MNLSLSRIEGKPPRTGWFRRIRGVGFVTDGELRQAASMLGAGHVELLGLNDSGLAGQAAADALVPDHPASALEVAARRTPDREHALH